jgi:hypothetical protein
MLKIQRSTNGQVVLYLVAEFRQKTWSNLQTKSGPRLTKRNARFMALCQVMCHRENCESGRVRAKSKAGKMPG